MDVHEISRNCKRTEFVGTAVLDTIGLCIAGVDDKLLQTMNIGTRYHALGLFTSRTGAAGQLTAMDEAETFPIAAGSSAMNETVKNRPNNLHYFQEGTRDGAGCQLHDRGRRRVRCAGPFTGRYARRKLYR